MHASAPLGVKWVKQGVQNIILYIRYIKRTEGTMSPKTVAPGPQFLDLLKNPGEKKNQHNLTGLQAWPKAKENKQTQE